MAVNTKALKARIRSVDSTMHITKAMELVASSKIKRARARMEEGRFYRSVLDEAFTDLACSDSVYSRKREGLPSLWVVIAGDRGLAGGYNNNVFKMALASLKKGDMVLPIGRRAAEYFVRRGYPSPEQMAFGAESLTTSDCSAIAAKIKHLYDAGEIGAVKLVSTKFVSMLTQETQMDDLLPLERREGAGNSCITYEPDPETVLTAIIPEYLAGIIYAAGCESLACEFAARRSAMDTATGNAQAMIEELNLKYNRARQSAITQEITEIVAGTGR